MERRKSILLGLTGGFALLLLNSPLFEVYRLFRNVGKTQSIQLILGISSLSGLIIITYFSILLIIDSLKSLHKK